MFSWNADTPYIFCESSTSQMSGVYGTPYHNGIINIIPINAHASLHLWEPIRPLHFALCMHLFVSIIINSHSAVDQINHTQFKAGGRWDPWRGLILLCQCQTPDSESCFPDLQRTWPGTEQQKVCLVRSIYVNNNNSNN